MAERTTGLRVLLLEDAADDAALIERELRSRGLEFTSQRVETEAAFLSELQLHPPDVILADHTLPNYDGFSALALTRSRHPEIPFIFVTGALGEEMAIETFQRGAADCVLKTRLPNLVPAILRALREKDERTKRRQVEEILRQSEERFRSLIEHSMDAIALLDPHGAILYASPAAARILGYSDHELMGQNTFALTHPDDLERTKALFTHCVQAPGRSVTAQYRYRHQNGSWVWLEAVGTNLLAEPSVRAFVTNFRDVTERKHAEKRLQVVACQQAALADLSKIALAGIDLSLLMEEAVELVVRTLRVGSATIFELLPDGATLRLSAGAGLDQALVGQVSAPAQPNSHEGYTWLCNAPVLVENWRTEARFERPSWIFRHGVVSAVCVPIKGRDQPFGVLAAYTTQHETLVGDEIYFLEAISYRVAAAIERRRSQEEIARLNADLEQRVLDRTAELKAAYQEMEAFSYSISHDLRAPLRHIGGFVELLAVETSGLLSDACQGYLQTIAQATKHMSKLINDLLELSRTSRAEFHRIRVPLADLVSSVRHALHKEFSNREIQWVIGDLPEVEGDPSLLRQALVNLISNALKYTRPRLQTRIEIGSLPSESELVFFVRDNGVGFDMEYAGKLFGVFQRLHSSGEFEGTGIGLANVRRIIERHGGRIWAEAKVNEGATFFFSLPWTKRNSQADRGLQT